MPGLEYFAQGAGAFFISGIWQGFVLAAGVGLCLRLIPRTSASLRFAVWAAVLPVIVMLPFVEHLSGRGALQGTGASLFPTLELDIRWSFAIVAVWAAMSLMRTIGLTVHGVRLWSLRRRAAPQSVSSECAALLSDRWRRVTLCTSEEVNRPSVIGFFAPRILIPAWLFAQLTAAELEQIVLHEMEHLRRGDDWLNLLQKLSVVLFPLNPALLWVERRLCFERELACDDGVLRRTRAPRAYASCLTSLAERGLDRRAISLALGVFGSAVRQSELARRVHRILRREATLSPIRARVLTGSLALGLLGGAVGLARCPQVVSFVEPMQPLHAAVTPLPAPMTPPPVAMIEDRAALPDRAEQVVFKSSEAPHVKLLTATERPTPETSQPPVRKTHRVASPVAEKTPAVRQVLTSATPQRESVQRWVVLSSWTEDVRPQLIVPVVSNPGDSNAEGETVLLPYAAVPTAGGWFLIEL